MPQRQWEIAYIAGASEFSFDWTTTTTTSSPSPIGSPPPHQNPWTITFVRTPYTIYVYKILLWYITVKCVHNSACNVLLWYTTKYSYIKPYKLKKRMDISSCLELKKNEIIITGVRIPIEHKKFNSLFFYHYGTGPNMPINARKPRNHILIKE